MYIPSATEIDQNEHCFPFLGLSKKITSYLPSGISNGMRKIQALYPFQYFPR